MSFLVSFVSDRPPISCAPVKPFSPDGTCDIFTFSLLQGSRVCVLRPAQTDYERLQVGKRGSTSLLGDVLLQCSSYWFHLLWKLLGSQLAICKVFVSWSAVILFDSSISLFLLLSFCLPLNSVSHFLLCVSLCLRVKPAIFDLLLAVCIAAYLGVMYLAIQVGHYIPALAGFLAVHSVQLFVLPCVVQTLIVCAVTHQETRNWRRLFFPVTELRRPLQCCPQNHPTQDQDPLSHNELPL